VHYIDDVKRARLPLFVLAALAVPSVASAAPGELRAVGLGTEGNDEYGYWEYLPTAYDEEEEWPLFVFLGGVGEVGTGVDDGPCSWPPPQPDFDGGSGLCNHLRHGPQGLIFRTLYEGDDLWDDEERPFVVIAPQNGLVYSPYDPGALSDFLDYVQATYAVDPRRLYLVGMSEGGHTIPTYLETDPDRLAAVAPLAGFTNDEPLAAACELGHQAIWMFHGENDLDFHADRQIEFWTALNACPAPHAPAKVTIYLGAMHDVWTRTINPAIGMLDATDPAYDPYDVDLYSWLLTIDKPTVDAGLDVVGAEDDDVIGLSATVVDADPITWEWTQIEGAAVTLVGDNTAAPGITDASAGELAFRVRVVDADGQFAEDEVSVTVQEGAGTSGGGGSEDDAAGSSDDDAGATSGSETGDCTEAGRGDDDEDGSTGGGGGSSGGGGTGGTDGIPTDDDGGATTSDDDGAFDGGVVDDGDDCGDGHDDADQDDDGSGTLTCECNANARPSPMAFGLVVLGFAALRRRRR
jgi:MYXO-CTERM domain-containing protein